METSEKLFMVMIGCRPAGRLTEQHDMFFGIGKTLRDLIPQIDKFWPEASRKWHIDAWREVTSITGYGISVVKKSDGNNCDRLYFINLGGYRPGEFEEYHYKLLAVADELSGAVAQAKQTAFYKHFGFKGAVSHVDDKYGIDVDEHYNVAEILSDELKVQYSLAITKTDLPEDTLHIGYLSRNKIV